VKRTTPDDPWLMGDLTAEIERQDVKHGPFTGTPLGRTRLAIACLEDEVREARDAWREDREADGWPHLREELLQVAAVAVRAIRDLPEPCVPWREEIEGPHPESLAPGSPS
jgi:hypothetical protein